MQQAIRDAVEENPDNKVVDLHLWTVGPGIRSALISIVSRAPQNPEHYKSMLPTNINLQHVSIEVHLYEES